MLTRYAVARSHVARISDRLRDWDRYSGDDWPTLLIGNGLSTNIWSPFSYGSLFDEASLSAESRTVFGALGTVNFEAALEAMSHATIVATALDQPTRKIQGLYKHVQNALFDTVRTVHVPWADIPRTTLALIASTLAGHRHVFTTSYDLLIYWSVMTEPDAFRDFFWGENLTFDMTNVNVGTGGTILYFLHGALHLWQRGRDAVTGKWATSGQDLLQLRSRFSRYPTRRPLFVSEGSSAAKLRTIRRSDYLSFAYDRLVQDDQPAVVFGSSLSKQDEHIVRALLAGGRRRVVVGIYPAGREHVLEQKASIMKLLDGQSVEFFDSRTHPLGDPALRQSPPDV